MSDNTIVLPSKPKVVTEEGFNGTYEIDGLYPGYGHTLGNSLRRIILSSLPGATITSIKIPGISHEFSTMEGIREDVITILLNLKKVRIKLIGDEAQTLSLKIKGPKEVTAGDITHPGQVEILNPELVIAHLTGKKELNMEMTVDGGLGYVPKEQLQKGRVDIGTIALDASFTPIRRVSYEVENMRVGDRTDFNRLRLFIETDGTILPREALETAIEIMINQLRSIVGFKEEVVEEIIVPTETTELKKDVDVDVYKTRIENVNFSARTMNALANANIRTIGGLARKKEHDLLEIEGLGAKSIQEIKRVIGEMGITLGS